MRVLISELRLLNILKYEIVALDSTPYVLKLTLSLRQKKIRKSRTPTPNGIIQKVRMDGIMDIKLIS
ncbi:MAG: hypothetical protein ACTSRP_01225 [Candidatus Helarchaeota archaeon]